MNDNFFNKCLICNDENITLNLSKNEMNDIYLSKKCNSCNKEEDYNLLKLLESYQINYNDNSVDLFLETKNKIDEAYKVIEEKIILPLESTINKIIKLYDLYKNNNNNIIKLGIILLKDKYQNTNNNYIKKNYDNIFIKNKYFFDYKFETYFQTEDYLKEYFFININYNNKINIQNELSINSFNFLIYEINNNMYLSCYENKNFTLTTYDIMSNKIINGPKKIHNNTIKTIKNITTYDNNDYLFSLSLDKSIKIFNINNNFSLLKTITFNYNIDKNSILYLEIIKSNNNIYIIHSGIYNVIYYYLIDNKIKNEQLESINNKKEIFNSNDVIILNKYFNTNNYIIFCNNKNIVYLYDFENKILFKYNKFSHKPKITFCNIVKFNENNYFYLIIISESNLYYIKYYPYEKIKIKNENYIKINNEYIFKFFINYKDFNIYLTKKNTIINIDNKNNMKIIINNYLFDIIYFYIIKINNKDYLIFLDNKGNFFKKEINI